MAKFSFSAQGYEYGIYEGATEAAARDAFAADVGYGTWAEMVARAEEFGGNTVESCWVREGEVVS